MSRLIRTAKLLCVAVALLCCSEVMAQQSGAKKENVRVMSTSKLTPRQARIASEQDATGAFEATSTKVEPSTWSLGNDRYVVKTNVLMFAAGAANVGAEVRLTDNISVDASIYYSPYAYSDSWSLKIVGVQPEVRYWLGDALKGHFVGVHAHAAVFNVAVDSDYRYESYDDEPMWGAGLTYGYAVKLCGNLGAEFTIGAGYASVDYNKYYNVDNGALVEQAVEKDYWGLTKLGATLTYTF